MLVALLAVAAAFSTPAPPDDQTRVRDHLVRVEAKLRASPAPAGSSLTAQGWRAALLDELQRYTRAGRFPHNHDVPGQSPVFIDAHGTHCAVASLVAASGDAALADAIAAADNLVRLPVAHAALEAWATAHGFTMAELAAIQPTYAHSLHHWTNDGALSELGIAISKNGERRAAIYRELQELSRNAESAARGGDAKRAEELRRTIDRQLARLAAAGGAPNPIVDGTDAIRRAIDEGIAAAAAAGKQREIVVAMMASDAHLGASIVSGAVSTGDAAWTQAMAALTNTAVPKGGRPFCLAVARGDAAMAALLFDAGADLDDVCPGSLDAAEQARLDEYGVGPGNGSLEATAIFWAVLHDDVVLARRLFDAGAVPYPDAYREESGFTLDLWAEVVGATKLIATGPPFSGGAEKLARRKRPAPPVPSSCAQTEGDAALAVPYAALLAVALWRRRARERRAAAETSST